MPISLKASTRYLIRTAASIPYPKGEVKDIVVAELSASGEYARVVWQAAPDFTALPVSQEWVPAAEIAALVIEELPSYKGQIFRAMTTTGALRSLPLDARKHLTGTTLPASS